MKLTPKLLASLVTLFAASLLHAAPASAGGAAASKVHRVLSIQDVQTDDPAAYAATIATSNEMAKSKMGIDTFIHIYVSTYDGEKTGSVRAVIAGDSVAAITKNYAALLNDPDMAATRDKLKATRKLCARVLYQGLRFDGVYKNGSVYTTMANVSDEAGYLKALDGLRSLFDAHDFKDAHINAYRVLAGRSDHTHRVTIVLPSEERLAALLDFVATDSDMAAWLGSAAKYRTVVSNGTAQEITK
jgi:hypothetical protein